MWFSLRRSIAGSRKRNIVEQKSAGIADDTDARHTKDLWQQIGRHFQWSRTCSVSCCRLRIRHRTRRVEGNVAFGFLDDLMNVAVQHRDRAEPAQMSHGAIGIAC